MVRSEGANEHAHTQASSFRPSNTEYCPCCRQTVGFTEHEAWLRDEYLCDNCHPILRQRHLTATMDELYPSWGALTIHKSSPSNNLIGQFCTAYSISHYFSDRDVGNIFGGIRCKNIESFFRDDPFDIFITQDALERVQSHERTARDPSRFEERWCSYFIAPEHRGLASSIQCANLDNSGVVRYILDPQYHGNPVGNDKALVA